MIYWIIALYIPVITSKNTHVTYLHTCILQWLSVTGATSDSGSGEMHLLPEPLFSIPTDNTYIVSITGAPNGRIFMAGKDGCLYELVYQVRSIHRF